MQALKKGVAKSGSPTQNGQGEKASIFLVKIFSMDNTKYFNKWSVVNRYVHASLQV